MIISVFLIPFILGILVFITPWKGARRGLLFAGALLHMAMTAILGVFRMGTYQAGDWVGLDSQGLLFLAITTVLFFIVVLYTIGYLFRDSDIHVMDSVEGFLFRNEPETAFISCLLFFLSTMSLVCISRHMGLLWVAVEATTLVSAPLIKFHRHHRSLEATWKYLLICSVGIAIALLGNYFLAFAGHDLAHMNIDTLIDNAGHLNRTWLKAAFCMLLVGYGTKMGLAPMHTWLPDAHSEAPSMVSALLSGALLNCAFLGILRVHSILTAAEMAAFSGELLVFFGMLSMAFAAVFMIRQNDYKRMLAYSSIEHMGIMALGAGVGGLAGTGAMLHAVNHSISKGMLFLISGQLLFIYGSKNIDDVRHILKTTPLAGLLWVSGFLAITGTPPFGMFLSEMTILKGIIDSGRWALAAGYLLILSVIFIAMARIIISMSFGIPENEKTAESFASGKKEPAWFRAPVLIMVSIILCLGFYIPGPLWAFLENAAVMMGGK